MLAIARAKGVLAFASRDRVSLTRAGATRSAAFEDVRDLAFDGDGRLYVATGVGLWLIEAGDTPAPRDVSPAPGEAARTIRRIDIAERWIAVATEAGAFVALRGSAAPRFVELDAAFPKGAVHDVAIARDGVLAAVGSSLWRAELGRGGEPYAVRELPLPSRLDAEEKISLATDLPGAPVALATGDKLFVRNAVDWSVGVGEPASAMEWTVLRPLLPPGARIMRLGVLGSGAWLATDRGLLLARTIAGPWRRADAPAGRAVVLDAVEEEGRLWIASSLGVLRGEVVSIAVGLAPDEVVDARALARVPSIRAVHRVALREQGLEASVVHEAWKGVRRRAWLPVVGLSFDVDRGRSREKERDESFVSGGYHTLHDLDRDRSLDLAAGVTFSWDFRDTAFEPEQIDLSREARLVIGLRDDVLDEVNQLYFDRLSVANQLAASDAVETEPAARGALRLRLQQLTAGLDAWTAGWFSEQLERDVPALE